MANKMSFLERLTGAINVRGDSQIENTSLSPTETAVKEWLEEDGVDGQLPVDVYQTPEEIIIKTMMAGVKPEDIEVVITRDMVTIKGRREESRTITEDNYFHKELYWGSFSRSVVLSQEIEPEEAEASERHGLLIIRLPKINREKQMRVKVKTTV